MCSLKHDAPKFPSDMDETSLPNIIKAIKMDPRILFALCEGKKKKKSDHVCSVKRETSYNLMVFLHLAK